MTEWFATEIVGPGRLPLFFMMLAFALAFAFIRISTRMIRADVSWWPGNVTPGGLHIHHVVFGLVMMLVSGFGFIALANYHTPVANCVMAAVFGVGSTLVLDEFALVLHLRDVYWTKEGRTSIDAVFVAFAITVLFVLGVHPLGFSGADFDTADATTTIASIVLLVVQYGLATIVLLKGKIWTGLFGLFFPRFSSSAPPAWDALGPRGHGGDTVRGPRRCATRIVERTPCDVLPIARKYESRKPWPVDSTAIRHHDLRGWQSPRAAGGTLLVQPRPQHEKA